MLLHLPVLGLPGAVRVLFEVAEEHAFAFDHELGDLGEHIEDLLLSRWFVSAHCDDVSECAHVAGPDAASCDAHADDAAQARGHALLVVEVVTAFFHVPDAQKFAVEFFSLTERLIENQATGLLARSEVGVIVWVFLQRGWHPKGDVLVEADVPHAAFGNRPSSAMAIHLAGEDTADTFDGEVVDRVLEDRAVS